MAKQINLDTQIINTLEVKIGPKAMKAKYTAETDRELADKAIDYYAMHDDLNIDKLLSENTVDEAKQKLHEAQDGIIELGTYLIDKLFDEKDAEYIKKQTRGRVANYDNITETLVKAGDASSFELGNY
ncbi:hypothetical protein D3P96_02980 [Weissella viridescens]|uniref:Uncharacterized protein n=1 Tax=Weissella viridescens TaxID=1629 RepID=A0A3P2RCE7_WEIVI|nr:hypothetical protein [Weissella viridescens]RRG18264.1 hypothetical protein D3P96_02980 [Weissella viridescens]